MTYAWFQASASMRMKFAPFWEFTLRRNGSFLPTFRDLYRNVSKKLPFYAA